MIPEAFHSDDPRSPKLQNLLYEDYIFVAKVIGQRGQDQGVPVTRT